MKANKFRFEFTTKIWNNQRRRQFLQIHQRKQILLKLRNSTNIQMLSKQRKVKEAAKVKK